MSGLQLFQNEASPYARKVKVVLIETGQLDDVELIASSGSPTQPHGLPLATNPLGKIPALIRPDGPGLFDSRVICRYFDARGGANLYPESSLWEVLTLEALADGILDAAVLMVYEHRCRPPEAVQEDWLAAQWSKVDRALDMVQDRWMSHLSGPLTMGQIGVGAARGNLDFRHASRDWPSGRTELTEWERAFAARPAMLETAPR